MPVSRAGYPERVASPTRISTRFLLVCAALGVATGIVSAAAGYGAVAVSAAAPIAYGLLLGVHVLPGVVAQEVLRRPWAAVATHVFAALVASAFSPQWTFRYLGTAVLIGGLQELVALLARYRHWEWWRFMISAVVIGGIIALGIGVFAHVHTFAPWAQALYVALFIVGPVAWTAIGVGIGAALRRAGVARSVR